MLKSTEPLQDAGVEQIKGCGPLNAKSHLRATPTKQQIYEVIRAHGKVARVDISKQVGISAGSVTTITAELIAAGLIREIVETDRDTESGRGRPPVSLSVNPESHFVVGIKLSTPHHSAVILDMAGNIRAEIILPCVTVRHQTEAICDFVETLLQQALSEAGLNENQIDLVGIGMPGFVDHQTGRVDWSPLLAGSNVKMRDILQKRLNRPVEVDNDANLLTLAELWFGAGRAMRDFAVVTIEHGIGMGLVIDNQLYRGARGMGMELGHTKVQLDGALCRCGQRGCLEAYVADYALVREASTALDMPNTGDISEMMEALFNEAKSGNEAARAIFHRAGRYLAVGLANVINLFDPSLIILSGDRIRYDYLYADEVLADMQTMTPNAHSKSTKIQSHQWGDLVWAQGAAALALSSVTNTIFET
ncbi:MAG: ROK family transcriptional regulator [Pseudomonadota bacterium]